MKSNYKRLEPYIKPVNNRNAKLEVSLLLGVSIKKVLMPSIANTVGTNMKTYKIIEKHQFAYGPVTSRNGDKISVALLEEHEIAIVSQAYTVFEVIDTHLLLPEYLMMWFRRPEFDRYARFKSHGSARETFDWDEMCDVTLPIPSIEKQKAIVAEYNTVVNRIQLNEKLNEKLEQTAQALYKHWFVDFGYPIEASEAAKMGVPELEGKPYKSSGGKMLYNEELEKEIPEGWEYDKLKRFVKLSQGQVINATTRYLVVNEGIPLLKITDLFNDTASMYIDKDKVSPKNLAKKEDLIYTRTGQVGFIFRNKTGVVYNNCFKVIPTNNELSKEVLYWFLKDHKIRNLMIDLASGSAQADLSHTAFLDVSIIKPEKQIQNQFSDISLRIVEKTFVNEEIIKSLLKLKSILLAKMTKVEEEKLEVV